MMAPAALVGTLLMCEGRASVSCVIGQRQQATTQHRSVAVHRRGASVTTLPLNAFTSEPINAAPIDRSTRPIQSFSGRPRRSTRCCRRRRLPRTGWWMLSLLDGGGHRLHGTRHGGAACVRVDGCSNMPNRSNASASVFPNNSSSHGRSPSFGRV